MATTMLRVAGEELDLKACRAWLPEEQVQNVWRKGEQERDGEISTDSGFALLLSDDEDDTRAVALAREAFAPVAQRVTQLIAGGANAEIDFGLFVTGASTCSLALDAADLSYFGEHGVRVIVSAYPCADED